MGSLVSRTVMINCNHLKSIIDKDYLLIRNNFYKALICVVYEMYKNDRIQARDIVLDDMYFNSMLEEKVRIDVLTVVDIVTDTLLQLNSVSLIEMYPELQAIVTDLICKGYAVNRTNILSLWIDEKYNLCIKHRAIKRYEQ